MQNKTPCVYILASSRNGTLYVGVTSDLQRRIHQHKSGAIEGFTKKYNIHSLVYFEVAETMDVAIAREKQLKGGSRQKKIALIEAANPQWRDISHDL
jgi:putative endonuclease